MTPDKFSDELLELMMLPDGEQPSSEQLCDVVLHRTTAAIRTRRRWRRAVFPAMLIACYLSGVATIRLWPTAPPQPTSAIAFAQNENSVGKSARRQAIQPEDDQVVGGTRTWQRQFTPYERLRRSGDRQLNEQDGVLAATRTYKKALQLATMEQRSIDPDQDSWLLMALKQSLN